MKCPHCLTDFHDVPHDAALIWGGSPLKNGDETAWSVRTRLCPTCRRAIISLLEQRWVHDMKGHHYASPTERLVWPKGVARVPLPPEVTKEFASDYTEACNVLADSPKASAALSRRCLQNILREKARVKPGKLHAEIDEVVNSGKLPPYISELLLDAVRHFGNFAAHPEKDVATGEIIDVEPGEAEWCLEILESLFDHYFVQPARVAARKAAINKKLTDAGKKPLD